MARRNHVDFVGLFGFLVWSQQTRILVFWVFWVTCLVLHVAQCGYSSAKNCRKTCQRPICREIGQPDQPAIRNSVSGLSC